MTEHRFWQEGPVPPTHAYVRRPADEEIALALIAGKNVHIGGSRQAGKSSLVRRALRRAQAERPDLRVALVDLQATGAHQGLEYSAWLANFGDRMLTPLLRSSEQARDALARAQPRTVASLFDLAWELAGPGPTILTLEEFDTLERFPSWARQLLGELRALQHADAHPGLQITLVTVKGPVWICADGAAAGPTELDGKLVWLDDFDFLADATKADVASGFEPHPGKTTGITRPLDLSHEMLRFTGGAPKATMWLGAHLAEANIDWSPDIGREIETIARRELRGGEPPAVIRIPANYIDEHGPSGRDACAVYGDLLDTDGVVFDNDAIPHQILRWSGLCRLDNRDRLVPRSPFYEIYYDQKWAAKRLDRGRGGANHPRRKQSAKRIAILLTGGTVGMMEFDDGGILSPGDPTSLIDPSPFEEIADVDFHPMGFSLDSADIQPRHWQQIAQRIRRLRGTRTPAGEGDGFDGFVVAHGTDTLAYSASAAAFAFGRGLDFPIVFTGAQTTPGVTHGDATSNLLRAVLTATYDIPEVVVAFGEVVLRGCRAQKKDDRRFDAFESPGTPPLGIIAEDVDVRTEFFRRNRVPGPPTLRADFSDGILQVMQTPGSYPEFFVPALDQFDHLNQRRCKGVVIQSLGAGNIPSKEQYSLVPLIEAARERDLPIMLTSAYPVHLANITRYSPALAAIRAGGLPTGNMTLPAVVAKLSWSIALVEKQIENGEIDENNRVAEIGLLMKRNEVDEVGEIRISTGDVDQTVPASVPN